ncbi:MAG: TerC family protein [Gammaproteobacteria bacterium]|nr:TerC family protein [Gammaproteobacteria bacterium]
MLLNGYKPPLAHPDPAVEIFTQLSKLFQILLVDLVLAGDNAIVIGMVAARFTPEYRRKVILWGVGAAVFLRVVFALLTVQLLAIIGLTLAGGLLLLWVCWKLWQDLRATEEAGVPGELEDQSGVEPENPPLPSAIFQIIVADVSMSLDNVIAVAGVAEGHTGLLVIGLALSIIFMMFFATWIADLLNRHRWIGYLGLLVILYVAVKLIIEGGLDIATVMG